MHCLRAKANNRTRGQFECNVTWFYFCFNLVCSYARCSCCSMVYLRFQLLQIKQIDCKMITKNVNNCEQKNFHDIFGQLHAKSIKPQKTHSGGSAK